MLASVQSRLRVGAVYRAQACASASHIAEALDTGLFGPKPYSRKHPQ